MASIECSEIFAIARIGDLANVQEFFENHPELEINLRNESGETLLIYCVKCLTKKWTLPFGGEFAAICEFLINRNIDVNLQDATGNTAMHYAVERRLLGTVKLLIQNNARLDIPEENDLSALNLIVLTGDVDWVRAICEACECEQISPRQNVKRALFHLFLSTQHKSCIRWMCENYQEVIGERNEESLTALHIAVTDHNLEALRILLEFNANMEAVDSEGHTPLHFAVVYGYADCLVLLLNNGAQVNCEDEGGATPLHFAVSTNLNHVDEGYGNRLKSDITIECLLNYGASVTSADNDGRVPLHWAANADNASACEIMVSRGCPVNTTCNDGLTALHIAASRGYTECMRVLVINCYADVNISDKTGHTPLLYALIMEHIDCAELLMCDGALPNTCNTGGLSPAHHAASKGLTSALEILHKYEGSLELVDAEGDRPLHKAAYHGQLDAVDYMLKCKCKVNVRNKEGFTPLHLAASVGAVPVCDRLLAGGACLNDIVMKDENGERQFVTALDLAHLNEHTDCLQFLTNEGAMCGQRVANFAATKIQKCWRRKHVFCRASRDTEGEEHKETSSDELSTGTDSQSAKIKEDRDERVQVKTTEQHESTTSGGSLSSLNEGRNVKAVQQHVDSSTACSTVSEDLPTETLNKDKDIEAIRELREDKGCANTGRGADEEIIDCTETSSKTNESRSMVSTDTTSDTPCEKNEQFTEENQSDNHRSVTLDNHAMVRGTSTYEKHNTSLGPGVGPTVNLRKAERQRSKVCERPREQKKLLQTRHWTRNSKLIKCKGMRLPRTVDADNVIANPKSQVKLRRVKSDNDKAQPKQQLRQSSEEQSLQVERNLNDALEAELSRTEELSRELERIKKNLNVRTRSLEQGLKEVEQKLRWT